MPCPTFPSDPDAWSKTLTPAEGYWAYGKLDPVFAKYGTYSIRSSEGLAHFEFSPYPNIKAMRVKRLYFWCALIEGLGDQIHIWLQDKDENYRARWIHVPPIKVWQAIDVSLFEGWTGSPEFDWEHVKALRVTGIAGQQVWVDVLHFYNPGASYLTSIKSVENSTDVPRTMYISGPDFPRIKFTTPTTFDLLQCNNDEYTIEAPEARFKQWEDGSTSPVRKYIPTKNATLTAYYSKFVRSTLTINSNPQGKTFTIAGVSGITPSTYNLDPNTPYIVSVDPTNFKQWEDGSTDPTRTITLAIGEQKTITAYYGPAPEENYAWLLVPTTLGLIGIGIYLKII